LKKRQKLLEKELVMGKKDEKGGGGRDKKFTPYT